MGLSYNDFLDMDIRQFNNYVEGFVDRRELKMNDHIPLIKILASQTSLAVWGSKKFSKAIKPIKLRGESRAAKIAQGLNALGMKLKDLDAYMKRRMKNGGKL